MDGITMDGIHYDVRVRYDTMDREFRLVEGTNAGDMLSGRHERDLVGTYYDYTLYVEPNPQNRAAYDAFYQAITAPQASHTITMPYGQETVTFEAMVSEGTDRYKGSIGGANWWAGLSVTFAAIKPQRTP